MLRIIRLVLMTFVFLGIAVGIVYYQIQKPPVTKDGIDEPMDLGGPFDLVDQNGRPCRSESFKGKYMIVYFGYSYCPDACPLALQNITKALKSLKRDRDQIVPVFITMDPERDTVEQLKTYSESYDENIYFLTGYRAAIDSVAKAYKTYAKKIENADTTDYLVDHSTLIYLVDREGKLISYFLHTIEPEKLSDVLVQTLAKDHKAT